MTEILAPIAVAVILGLSLVVSPLLCLMLLLRRFPTEDLALLLKSLIHQRRLEAPETFEFPEPNS